VGSPRYHPDMLIAEEFVLLVLAPDGRLARGVIYQSAVAIGVTAALVTELALDGHIELGDGRIHLTGTRPADPLLAQVLDSTASHEGKKLKRRLASITRAGWTEVVDRMISSGVLGRDESRLRPTRHPVTDHVAHAQLLADVRSAAKGSGALDPRMATLLALAGPCQQLEVVAPERSDRAAAKKRIDGAADQVPAAGAAKAAIEAAQAAAAAVIASTAAANG